jgi:hypothetical protein
MLFLVGAIEVWLRRRQTLDSPVSWYGAFQDSAVGFVDGLIEDNRDLFDWPRKEMTAEATKGMFSLSKYRFGSR